MKYVLGVAAVVAALLVGAASERALTGHVAWAPAAVVSSPSPYPSPYASASPYPDTHYIPVPGPVRTVLEQKPPDYTRCVWFSFGSFARNACEYGAGLTEARPYQPDCYLQFRYSSDLLRACQYGQGD